MEEKVKGEETILIPIEGGESDSHIIRIILELEERGVKVIWEKKRMYMFDSTGSPGETITLSPWEPKMPSELRLYTNSTKEEFVNSINEVVNQVLEYDGYQESLKDNPWVAEVKKRWDKNSKDKK